MIDNYLLIPIKSFAVLPLWIRTKMDSLTAKFVTAHPIGPLQSVFIELTFYRKQTDC